VDPIEASSPSKTAVQVVKEGHRVASSDVFSFGAATLRDSMDLKSKESKEELKKSPPKPLMDPKELPAEKNTDEKERIPSALKTPIN
jgi:hypothetical protein